MEELVAGFREVGGLSAFANVVDCCCLDDLPAVVEAIVANHFAKAGEVAQACIEAAACKWRSDGVDGHIGILLRTQLTPDAI
ncbi:hypothetical protein D3C72_1673510 [compost metagenome]